MNTEDVVKKICTLPLDFYAGSKSTAELVRDSGISAPPEALTAFRIAAYIKTHPQLVDEWLSWSANKRVKSGWYFAYENAAFVVRLYPDGKPLSFDDAVSACAEFVVREVGAIATIASKKK